MRIGDRRGRQLRHRRARDLWLHHPGCGPADATHGPGEPGLGLDERRGRDAAAGGAANAGASKSCGGVGLSAGLVGGRRALDGH